MARKLALMGSGENSPAMVTPHQNILKSYGKQSQRLNLDTPYGFQENVDEMTEKIRKYFAVNVGYEIDDVNLRSANETVDSVREKLAAADWVFAGPGSPTYVLRTWQATGVDQELKNLLQRGALVLASAAAMSIGAKVMPVYEMYKVGDEPFWHPGFNLLEEAIGVRAAVIAHYNNAQGGTHDTRFCFAGEKRMKVLESLLEDDIGILGIDEHTGITFDLDAGTYETYGKGKVTVKKGEKVLEIEPKSTGATSSLNFASPDFGK